MCLSCFAAVQVGALECAPNDLLRVNLVPPEAPAQKPQFKEIPLSKIARRKFIQLSAAAAAGCFVQASREVRADDLPHLSPDDPMATAMKYTHDAASVDPAARNNPAAEQNCSNCALVQGNAGDEWRPCQIFPGKAVAAAGWCSVWAPKA